VENSVAELIRPGNSWIFVVKSAEEVIWRCISVILEKISVDGRHCGIVIKELDS